MPMRDDLGVRMKTFYEQIPKMKLMRRTPVIIRIDGKSFHTFTKGFKKPFDEILMKTMQETTKYLCENIQGCVLGYTQSDEISLVLVDYERFETSAWFDYEVQKMCSVAAGMATMAFNRYFNKNIRAFMDGVNEGTCDADHADIKDPNRKESDDKYINTLQKAADMGAIFDARVFNIPKEEVTNCIYWRQLDASRNSVQMVGQAHFKQKELQGKSSNNIQDMLMLQKGINWNDLPVEQKRGSCVIKETYTEKGVERSRWKIDKEIPIFKGEDRNYIEKLIMVGE